MKNSVLTSHTVRYSSFLCCLYFLLAQSVTAAGFEFNFNLPSSNSSAVDAFNLNCPSGSTSACAWNDGTNFYQGSVSVGGVSYWHNIVGDPSSGFAIEYYTRLNSGSASSGVYAGNRGNNPYGGGMEQSFTLMDPAPEWRQGAGNDVRAVPGDGLCNAFSFNHTGGTGPCGNGYDPLGHYRLTGSGSNDPSKTVMRMILDYGDGMTMEVSKPLLSNKPKITQTVVDGDLRSEFIADMRGLSYSRKGTAAPLVNNQVIDDPALPAQGIADFDMNMVDKSKVTAGRFTFTAGQGWGVDNGAGWEATTGSTGWREPNSAFDYGVYDYGEDSFDVLNTDWASFFSYSQNATECTLPKGTTTVRPAASCPQ
ncbi:MAG: hypothetical protein ACE5EH_09670 [Gammaproteobacteria bacterium]